MQVAQINTFAGLQILVKFYDMLGAHLLSEPCHPTRGTGTADHTITAGNIH